MRKISVSAMDGVLVGRRELIHSGVFDLVNMWTRVRHLKELLAVVVQDSHRVKAGLLQLNPTIPFVDNDAYVDSSDVSLAGYICTHVCLFMFLQRDFGLVSSSAWTSTFSLLPQLRSCALGRIW